MRCVICYGKAKRLCPACKKRKVIKCDRCLRMDANKPGCFMCAAELDRLDYLLLTWYKCKKFKLTTTGCDTLDAEVKAEFGYWELPEPRLM